MRRAIDNAKPKNPELRAFNRYLQEMQGKLHRHYRDLLLEDEPLTAAAVKAGFLGIEKEKEVSYSLLWLVNQHETMMQKVLKPGTMTKRSNCPDFDRFRSFEARALNKQPQPIGGCTKPD